MPKDQVLETALVKAREEFEEARTRLAEAIAGIADDKELPLFIQHEFRQYEDPRRILPRLSIEFERALRIARGEDHAHELYSKRMNENRSLLCRECRTPIPSGLYCDQHTSMGESE